MNSDSIVQIFCLLGIVICLIGILIVWRANKRKELNEVNCWLLRLCEDGSEKIRANLIAHPHMMQYEFSFMVNREELRQLPGFQKLWEMIRDIAEPVTLPTIRTPNGNTFTTVVFQPKQQQLN